jgi:hypothetical protein
MVIMNQQDENVAPMLQKLMLHELAKNGFPQAEYAPESGAIKIPVDGAERPILITADGGIRYMAESRDVVMDTLKPLVDGVTEMTNAWNHARDMPVEGLPNFRLLAEYNGVVLAARDDTEHGHGLHFVTWEYNYERTGMHQGHYTEDYGYAKEDFAVRSGLVSAYKIIAPEQAAEIKASVAYRIEKDESLTLAGEDMLKDVAKKLERAYPALRNAEKPPGKKPSISQKLQEGKEKVDAEKAKSPAGKAKKRAKEMD